MRWKAEDLAKIRRRNDNRFEKPRFKAPGPGANALTKECLFYMNFLGFECWRVNNTGIYDPVQQRFRASHARKGIPDINGYSKKDGRAVWIEVKAGRDKLSPEQSRFLDEAREAGCVAFVYRGKESIENYFNVKLK